MTLVTEVRLPSPAIRCPGVIQPKEVDLIPLSRMKTTLLATCSLLALAVPAATAAADNGVPKGHVLEFAKQTTITGSAGNDGSTLTKAFVTQHARTSS